MRGRVGDTERATGARPARNRRVLVAEAELLTAAAIERALGKGGWVVLGPAPSVTAALAWIATGPPEPALRGAPRLEKPFRADELTRAVAAAALAQENQGTIAGGG